MEVSSLDAISNPSRSSEPPAINDPASPIQSTSPSLAYSSTKDHCSISDSSTHNPTLKPYIYLQPLSTSQRSLYKSFAELKSMSLDSESDDDELKSVVGEYQDQETLFYYARREDGICHKVCGL